MCDITMAELIYQFLKCSSAKLYLIKNCLIVSHCVFLPFGLRGASSNFVFNSPAAFTLEINILL
jgi:hypothetical protein